MIDLRRVKALIERERRASDARKARFASVWRGVIRYGFTSHFALAERDSAVTSRG